MAQYIDKSALVAEIERLKTIYKDDENIRHVAKYNVLVYILSFLNTLKVKEIDLEKEIESYYFHQCDLSWCKDLYSLTYIRDTLSKIAKHFFELGLKAKGE